jgi:N,N'-diacetyllegionaminate synthase
LVMKTKAVVDINGRKIGQGHSVFVIAEIGINHNGDFNIAKELINKAKWSGADAVKLQTYITEKRVSKTSPIFDILKQCELSFNQQKDLFDYARNEKIEMFSTPFDEESVDFLYSINAPCYKIASFDIVNKKLVKKIASQKRPVIISRGMATQLEIDTAVHIMNKNAVDIILLHCISAYPVSSYSSLHMETIRALKQRYSCPVGFSDHTLGIEAAKYSVAAGADVIEKHFTLSRDSKGPDHSLSAEPHKLKEMIEDIRMVSDMLGEPVWSSVDVEKDILQYRRIT